MNEIGKPERETRNRVIRLFHEEPGHRIFGDLGDRIGRDCVLCATFPSSYPFHSNDRGARR